MKIYLDNCCFNRPFDDQTHYRIRLETEAKLYIQDLLRQGVLQFVWSYMLDYENGANPFIERREAIGTWRTIACQEIEETDKVIELAENYVDLGIRVGDSLHISCAVVAGCQFFITTDDEVLKKNKNITGITITDPTTFLREFNR